MDLNVVGDEGEVMTGSQGHSISTPSSAPDLLRCCTMPPASWQLPRLGKGDCRPGTLAAVPDVLLQYSGLLGGSCTAGPSCDACDRSLLGLASGDLLGLLGLQGIVERL